MQFGCFLCLAQSRLVRLLIGHTGAGVEQKNRCDRNIFSQSRGRILDVCRDTMGIGPGDTDECQQDCDGSDSSAQHSSSRQ